MQCGQCGTEIKRGFYRVLPAISAGIALLIVAACSGGDSKGEVADAINKKIGEQKVCFKIVGTGPPTWPMRVNRPTGAVGDMPLDPILAAMQAAGYLHIDTMPGNPMRPTIDVVTPTEEAKGWYDPKIGFCVGEKSVAEIREVIEPPKESGMLGKALKADYTWKLANVPSWAKRAEFNAIPGMNTPVPATAALQKTGDGWQVVMIM